MKRLIVREEFESSILEMARIGFIPLGTTKTIEVYVYTDDPGKIPYFHVRKYGKNNKFEWETCIRYDKEDYFAHGKYDDTFPDRKTAKELDKMLRQVNKKSKITLWRSYVNAWNDNNSNIELDLDIE